MLDIMPLYTSGKFTHMMSYVNRCALCLNLQFDPEFDGGAGAKFCSITPALHPFSNFSRERLSSFKTYEKK